MTDVSVRRERKANEDGPGEHTQLRKDGTTRKKKKGGDGKTSERERCTFLYSFLSLLLNPLNYLDNVQRRHEVTEPQVNPLPARSIVLEHFVLSISMRWQLPCCLHLARHNKLYFDHHRQARHSTVQIHLSQRQTKDSDVA